MHLACMLLSMVKLSSILIYNVFSNVCCFFPNVNALFTVRGQMHDIMINKC